MAGIQRQLLLQPCSIALCQEFHEELGPYNDASSRSSFEDSLISSESVSTLDSTDDGCSSVSNSSSHSKEPLEDFTELYAQLPIKRGLSMFYQGKSQSFTSLSSVKSIEDLPKKKENAYNGRLVACKSYAAGLDTHKSRTFKKASRSSLSFVHVQRGSSLAGCPPPSIPIYDESF